MSGESPPPHNNRKASPTSRSDSLHVRPRCLAHSGCVTRPASRQARFNHPSGKGARPVRTRRLRPRALDREVPLRRVSPKSAADVDLRTTTNASRCAAQTGARLPLGQRAVRSRRV